MLDGIIEAQLETRAFRYVAEDRKVESLKELDLSQEEIEEVLVNAMPSSLEVYLDYPFKQPLVRSDPTVHRFSDGTIPILYTALEPETAEAEVLARRAKMLVIPTGHVPVYFMLLSCQFSGTHIDLRPHVLRLPFLTGTDRISYEQCARLGSEVAARPADALLSPSARKVPDGTCLPVFTRDAVTDPRRENIASFIFDPQANSFRKQML